MTRNIHKGIVAIAIGVLMILPLFGKSSTTKSPGADADLRNELRIVDRFMGDLARFDKMGAQLGKKLSLTQREFAPYQQMADDLTARLRPVQNALAEVIKKLKAAGQWDNLNQLSLERIPTRHRSDFDQRNFKGLLEELASTLADNANEISNSVQTLRNKMQRRTQNQNFKIGASVKGLVKCGIAWVRQKIKWTFTDPDELVVDEVDFAVMCYCDDNTAACGLAGITP